MRLLIAALFLSASGCGSVQPEPRQPIARVDDQADLLTPEAEQRIAAELAELEKRTTDQVAVKTIPSLNGKTVEEFALDTARNAGLGIKGKDNGVLLLVAPRERKVRIETGRGIAGVLTDAEAGVIVRDMTVHFRAGEMQEGIEAGVQAIDRELSADPTRPALLRRDEPWPA